MNAQTLPYRLILASGSWGRKWLLETHGYTFDVQPSNVDEPTEARLGSCRQYVGELAWLKADNVAMTVDEGVVLAADTVGWLDGKVIGKPDDEAHARQILHGLSGRVHELWTGICLWVRPNNMQYMWQERSLVRMVELSKDEIDTYIASLKWEGCSGAYSLEFPTDPYLTVIEGSTSNVVGLPMESLAKALNRLAVPNARD